MKVILILLLTSLGIGGAACLTNSPTTTAAAAEIVFKQKDNVTYLYAPKTGEILFLEHDPGTKIDYQPGQKVSYDIQIGEVKLLAQDGTPRQTFSTNASRSGAPVHGIGIRTITPGDYSDDDVFARNCGCFGKGNLPMVDGKSANCSNNNPELSTGCGYGSSIDAVVFILGAEANMGRGTNCNVTCGASAYACCIEEGMLDE